MPKEKVCERGYQMIEEQNYLREEVKRLKWKEKTIFNSKQKPI